MESKKRLMFNLNEDFNYITLKMLMILHAFNSYHKEWIDIRKIGILIEFQRGSLSLIRKTVRGDELTSYEKAKLLEIYTKGKIHEVTIRKVLKSLDSKNIIKVTKNDKYLCLNILLLKSSEIIGVLNDDRFKDDLSDFMEIKEIYSRVKTVKFDSFVDKAVRGKEVLK